MWQINLIPEDIQKEDQLKLIGASVLASAVATCVLALLIHAGLTVMINQMKKVADGPAAVKEDTSLAKLKGTISRLEAEQKQLYKTEGPLIEMLSKRYSYDDILLSIGNVSADKVWLQDISINSDEGLCGINGNSFNSRLVSEYMLELKKMPYFKGLELSSVEKSENKSDMVDFKIVCKFN
ncbi:MAG TPA: PilN domain-containing protein [Candidatus Omnitrophota bacterium]|nr:PilN domain-containing protein [Candidatus Omnitrophota bacterium]